MLTALALLGATASIVFQGLVKLLSESFYAMHRIAVPLVAMPLGTIVFFVATKYLSEAYGIFGLTLASSTVAGMMTIAMAFILAYILPKFDALLVVKRMLLFFVLAAIGGVAGVALSAFLGLDGLFRLIVSFAVLIILYAGVLWLLRETIFARVLRSIRTAVASDKGEASAS